MHVADFGAVSLAVVTDDRAGAARVREGAGGGVSGQPPTTASCGRRPSGPQDGLSQPWRDVWITRRSWITAVYKHLERKAGPRDAIGVHSTAARGPYS